MKESNPFWQPIQNALFWAKTKSVIVVLLIAVAFPLAEAIFVNLWTAAPPDHANAFLIALGVLAVFHAVLTLVAVVEEVRSRSETILPKAFQLEEDSEKLERELKRREMKNKLVRLAFDRVNLQACEIEYSPSADAWCLGGFAKGLAPIIEPFMDQLDSTLGVRGNRFSVEVYFQRGTVPVQGCKNDCHRDLSQLAFYAPHVGNCIAVSGIPTKCSPAQIGFDAGKAFEQHIDECKHLFHENGAPIEQLYFRRYATCPINENCGDLAEGVLVLTSMQDEPFADDVLDTLAFLATITSSYLSAYRRCFELHNPAVASAARRVATAPKSILGLHIGKSTVTNPKPPEAKQ